MNKGFIIRYSSMTKTREKIKCFSSKKNCLATAWSSSVLVGRKIEKLFQGKKLFFIEITEMSKCWRSYRRNDMERLHHRTSTYYNSSVCKAAVDAKL